MAWIRACGGGSPAIPDGKTATPLADVELWLECGGIFGSTYTTIGEILADNGVLSTLMASDNAADYLVRSSSWASTVCANQSAMEQIGANNYTANTLLGDSTWSSAICTSAYYEKVLNVKVPLMTSNTTPSGAVSASSTWNDYYPYLAFNRNNGSKGWMSADQLATCWLQYAFTEQILLKKVVTYSNGSDTVSPLTIMGSNDGSNFTNIGSTSFTKNTSITTNLPSNYNKYKYIRLQGAGFGYGEGYKAQFYGRKDV